MNARDWTAMVEAYVLGALEPEERADFEARLEEDESLRARVRDQGEVLAAMAASVPQVAPPAALRDRIMAHADAVTPVGRGRPRVEEDTAPTDARSRGANATGSPLPGRSLSSPTRIPWLLTAAMVVISLGLGTVLRRTAAERDRLQDRYRDAVAAAADAQAQAAQKDSVLANLLTPATRSAALAATGEDPTVRLFWNEARGVFVVTAFGLPAPPTGRTYQLWAIPEGDAPLSIGTFETDESGRVSIVLPVPAAVAAAESIQVSALTMEPEGGSAQPTETPRLVGSWISSD